jgi:hypothetical protein
MKKTLLSTAVAALLGISGSAVAGTITFTFNPDGNGLGAGAINGAALLDWAPGNTVAVGGAGGGALLPVGTAVTDYFQANLGSVIGTSNNNLFSNGTGGNYFTIVAGFGETVNFAGGNAAVGINTFGFDAGAANFFKVYKTTTAANDLTGAGFTSTTEILSGSIVGLNASVTAFFQGGAPLLDGFGNNDWGDVLSLLTTGSASLLAKVTSVDANYFPDLPLGTTFDTYTLSNSSLITPYNQADPSRCFSSDGVTSCNYGANVGAVNGISGPNFIFQSDANSSFAVPEPGSVALFGAALLGFALSRKRKF